MYNGRRLVRNRRKNNWVMVEGEEYLVVYDLYPPLPATLLEPPESAEANFISSVPRVDDPELIKKIEAAIVEKEYDESTRRW